MEPVKLLQLEKPARYIGHEPGSRAKDHADLRVVLAFPDVYEVGMSHLGLQILYAVLNSVEWISAERVYAPWPDMARLLAETRSPLTSLESGRPVRESDILGFTLQYELSYSNILAMMEEAGIPLLAKDRDDTFPLVIGGGPCAFNPEPLADFFDAFLLGDGEEAVVAICEAVRRCKQERIPRQELLEKLAAIEGVYVPSFFQVTYDDEGRVAAIIPQLQGYTSVRRTFVTDLEKAPYPTAPVVPLLRTVHDRVSLEIARGCTRGCRFCQAGYLYRPVRERSPDTILQLAEETLKATGYDELSLLSLSTGDYSCIGPLMKELMHRYADSRIAVSFPSLRVGTLTGELVEEVKKVRKTGFTLAPEAGSERLRQSINKGITEDDLLANAREAFRNGWRVIKLYFMIGLPGETDEDLAAIVDLGARTKATGREAGGHPGDVTVSVGTFVPKPNTPFQWEPQISVEETRRRHNLLRTALKKRRLTFKWHDPCLSYMEGVFARGDRRLGAVLLAARAEGCAFDGWGEHFNMERWLSAFRTAGIDPDFYHRRRLVEEILPWDHLQCGVDRSYLLRERQEALEGRYTPDCRNGSCNACGICDFRDLRMRLTDEPPTASSPSGHTAVEGSRTIRLRHEKRGPLVLLSHLELISVFSRAVSRGGIPIRFSQGFHPHPKFSFATALSVGIDSAAEYFDMEIEPTMSAEEVMIALNGVLPVGLKILEAREMPPKSPSLSTLMEGIRYRLTFPAPLAEDLPAALGRFLALEDYPLVRKRKKGDLFLDLRQELLEASLEGNLLTILVRRGKPLEFAAAITGRTIQELESVTILKSDVVFAPSPHLQSGDETVS